MERGTTHRHLLNQAISQLGRDSRCWTNVLAFLQSCYAGRVRHYDFEAAVTALSRLSDAEQNALIAWVMLNEEHHELV